MKYQLSIIISALYINCCYCQISKRVDSTTVVNISQTDANASKVYFDIYSYEISAKLYTRLDTLKYDYAFVQVTYSQRDSTFQIDERYFVSSEIIPIYFFYNGNQYNTREMYSGLSWWYEKTLTNDYTQKAMIKRYRKLKNIQSLPYDKIQIWPIACVNNGTEAEFKKEKTEELKHSFQIQTFIDKKKNKIIVSIQTPPKKPKYKTLQFNIGKYL